MGFCVDVTLDAILCHFSLESFPWRSGQHEIGGLGVADMLHGERVGVGPCGVGMSSIMAAEV